jgi:hypothetical protein
MLKAFRSGESLSQGYKSLISQKIFFIVLLFLCAYKAWVISPPPPPSSPTPSIPSRNYFALISNFVEERV